MEFRGNPVYSKWNAFFKIYIKPMNMMTACTQLESDICSTNVPTYVGQLLE